MADDRFVVGEHVERHTEVLAVDFPLGAVRDAVPHRLVVDLAIALDLQRHGPGDALDRQVAREPELAVALRLDPRAAKRDGGILVELEEVRRKSLSR